MLTVSSYPIPYPLETSVASNYTKLTIKDVPQKYMGTNICEWLYPDIKADKIAYMAGVTRDKWDEFYKSIYIMSCEFQLNNIVIVWSPDIVVHIVLTNLNWRQYFQLPQNFREQLTYHYSIGFCIGLVGNSVRKTVEMNPYPVPYQMYLNSNKQSKVIHGFNHLIVPAFDVTEGKSIFAHSCVAMNLSGSNEVEYIKKALCCATANGMKGVVFHCGSSTDRPVDQALQMLANNIVAGIRAAMFSPTQIGTAKFILETPAGQGKEVLTNINDFIKFCNYIATSFPDVAPHFSVCVDTCHVHQCGYAPHKYLEYIHNIHPVSFVHFNDSKDGWCCRKDNHAKPGEGHIPWPFLVSVAEFCKNNSIPVVYEN